MKLFLASINIIYIHYTLVNLKFSDVKHKFKNKWSTYFLFYKILFWNLRVMWSCVFQWISWCVCCMCPRWASHNYCLVFNMNTIRNNEYNSTHNNLAGPEVLLLFRIISSKSSRPEAVVRFLESKCCSG